MPYQYKYQIQNHIQNRANNEKIQGCFGIPQRFQNCRRCIIKQLPGNQTSINLHIQHRIIDNIFRCSQKLHQRSCTQKNPHAQKNAHHHRDPYRVGNRSFHLLILLCAKLLRKNHCKSICHTDCYLKKSKCSRICRPNSSQRFSAYEFSQNNTVCHIIHKLKQGANQ